MKKIIFMNIGWMSKYEGLNNESDKIINGGSYVSENKTGGEVCNFHCADDENFYGFVEHNNKTIHFEAWNENEIAHGVTVIWTASLNGKGKCIVGVYKNATVYSNPMKSNKYVSVRHQIEDLSSYSVKASKEDVIIIPENERYDFRLPPKWVRNWRIFDENVKNYLQISSLILKLEKKIKYLQSKNSEVNTSKSNKANGTPKEEYIRYVKEYEVKIIPKHNTLQCAFIEYLNNQGIDNIHSNNNYIDVTYKDKSKNMVFSEIKPCTKKNARFAIRQAMGQLLDYKHKEKCEAKLLIVIETPASKNDIDFALTNNFGIAFPTSISKKKFEIIWKPEI